MKSTLTTLSIISLLFSFCYSGQNKNYSKDNIPPKLTIISPVNNLFTNQAKILVSGRVEDASPVNISINGKLIFVNHQGHFNTLVSIQEGKNIITIIASDKAGNKTTANRTIIVDSNKPVLTITEPVTGLVTKNNTVKVSGTVYDSTTVTIRINGLLFPVDRNGNFSGTASLKEGKNNIVIIATDAAKNVTVEKRIVIKDTTPPKIKIFTPANNTVTTDNLITVCGRVKDRTRTKVRISINNGDEIQVDVRHMGFFKQAVPLVDGKNIIKVIAIDAIGNTTTVTRIVTKQSGIQLRLIVEEPTDGMITKDASVIVKGTATTTATVKVNGVIIPVASDGSFTTSVNLSEGENVITVTAASGTNTLKVTRVVIRDTKAPILVITEPEDGLITKDTEITVNGTVSDITGVTLFVNGDSAEVKADESFEKLVSLYEGINIIEVAAVDEAGNRSEVTRKVRLDTQSPALTVTLPPDNYITNQPDVVVGGTVFDATVVTVSVQVGSPEWTSTTPSQLSVASDGSFAGTFALTEGVNVFEITATDKVGNQTTITRTVTKDSQPPILTITSPEDGSVTGDNIIIVSGNVIDLTAVTVTVQVGSGTPSQLVVGKDGTFSQNISLEVGQNIITITAVDALGQSAIITRIVMREGVMLPPDPAEVAPPIDMTVPTTVYSSTSFLYTGDNPIQRGMNSNTIDPIRVAVLRGKVMKRDLTPLPGVKITILNHPEYGYTLTRLDGMFDIAVNGGGYLTIRYEKEGYLPLQRQVDVPWQDYVVVDSVVMTQLDTVVTTINFTEPIEIARGSVVTDEDGTRQATLFFKEGTTAKMVKATGDTVVLPTINVRATEYTVGPNGPSAMPAELPPAVGYTYCVELSVDEAITAGALSVEFDKPVSFYVDNFLDLPVGCVIPAGYYDRQRGKWIALRDARVISIVSITDGIADIDMSGNGLPEDTTVLALHGLTISERISLGEIYPIGKTIWRSQTQHFSPYDLNLIIRMILRSLMTPKIAEPNSKNPTPKKEDTECGSIIKVQSQTLGQSIPISGTPFAINYSSNRVTGKGSKYQINIPVSDSTLPAEVYEIILNVHVAGRNYAYKFPPTKSLTHRFYWDGKDSYGRTVSGKQRATIKIGYKYEGLYWIWLSDPLDENSFTWSKTYPVPPANAFPMRVNDCAWNQRVFEIGGWDAMGKKNGGWELAKNHLYSYQFQTIFQGSGVDRRAGLSLMVINTVDGTVDTNSTYSDAGDPPSPLAIGSDGSIYYSQMYSYKLMKRSPDGTISIAAGTGENGYSGDGGLATEARIDGVTGLAVASDGTIYFSDYFQNCIRKIDPNGIITTIAGTVDNYSDGEGGLATEALIYKPGPIALGPDGSLYVIDSYDSHYSKVRRITPDGRINTYAGTGESGFSGDSGLAILAQLYYPKDICVDKNGTLYIADTYNGRIRKVSADGIITTIAGTGRWTGETGDGGPAIEAEIEPYAISVTKDGTLFFIDYNCIRYIRPDGIVLPLCGTGNLGFSGDGGPAFRANLNFPDDIAIAPDGDVYFSDSNTPWPYWSDGIWPNRRIRHISLIFSGYSNQQMRIAEEDGSQILIFDNNGRHIRTDDGITGTPIYTFVYNSDGTLGAICDIDSLITFIERDVVGNAKAIVSPYGLRTILSIDSTGYLKAIINPEGEIYSFTYSPEGLMMSLTDPKKNVHTFEYDSIGRIYLDINPEGGFTQYDRTQFDNGYEILVTTAEGRKTKYKIENLSTGEVRKINTDESGLATTVTEGRDGTMTSVYPDGTLTINTDNPDPRFGMQAPLTTTVTKLPSGLKSKVEQYRRISQMTGLEVAGLTDSVVVNGRTYKTIWDGTKKLFTTVSPVGRQTFTYVNDKDRVIKDSIPGIAATYYSYDPQGRLVTVSQGGRTAAYTYNAQSYLATATDPIKRVSRFEYDSVGRITRQVLPDNHEILYTYDANGNLTTLMPPTKPAHGFDYNKVDLTTQYAPPILGMDTLNTRYEYNKDKDIVRVIRPDGGAIETIYDSTGCGSCGPVGRPKKILFDRGALTFGYNPITGNLDTLVAPGDTLLYTYDGSLPTSVEWKGNVKGKVSVTYDNNMRVTSQSINGGNTVNYTYDNDGLLTKVGDMNITREAATGRISGTTLGNVTTSQTYNSLGELSSYQAKYGATTIFGTNYQRDSLGRITQITEIESGVTKKKNYTYDVAGRLWKVWRNDTLISTYTYDANGNRLSHWTPSKIDSGAYDAQDRLLSYSTTQVLNYSTTLYSYTPNGELKIKVEGADTTRYTYDYFGNLVNVRLPNDDLIEYLIDGQNRRVGKKVNGKIVKKWIYSSGTQIAAELDSNNQIVMRFTPYYAEKNGKVYRIITDHLSSVKLIIDVSTGDIVEKIDYDEFGNIIYDSNAEFMDIKFAGGLYDNDTRLIKYGAREYYPETGRWVSKDPIGFDGGVSNLYEYVLNDPINYLDPDGLQGIGIIGSISAEIGFRIGLGGTGALGGGFFWGGEKGKKLGAFASGGGFAGDPCEDRKKGIVGAFIGGGIGAFYTNATSASQLSGPFKTYSFNLAIGSVGFSFQYSFVGDIKMYSLTFGPGIGLSASGYTTYTTTTR